MALSAHHKTPLILAVESSASQASAAVSWGDKVLAEAKRDAAHGHAAWLVSLVQEVVDQSGHDHDKIDVILGGTGPGSFTGIRVALAAAKGFGLTRGIAPVGISSLAGLAASVDASPVLSVIDSRRKTRFYQLFSPDLKPLTNIGDGGDVDLVKSVTAIADMPTPITITGHDQKAIAAMLMEAGIDAVAQGPDNPDARGLITAYHRNADLASTPEPLYVAPPILGGAKLDAPILGKSMGRSDTAL